MIFLFCWYDADVSAVLTFGDCIDCKHALDTIKQHSSHMRNQEAPMSRWFGSVSV